MDTIPKKCLRCIEEILDIKYNMKVGEDIEREYFRSEHFRKVHENAIKEACGKIYNLVPKDDYSI